MSTSSTRNFPSISICSTIYGTKTCEPGKNLEFDMYTGMPAATPYRYTGTVRQNYVKECAEFSTYQIRGIVNILLKMCWQVPFGARTCPVIYHNNLDQER
jgi:hypothetical protein